MWLWDGNFSLTLEDLDYAKEDSEELQLYLFLSGSTQGSC